MDEQETPRPEGQQPGTSLWSDQPVVRPPLGLQQPVPPADPVPSPTGPSTTPPAGPPAPAVEPTRAEPAGAQPNPFAPPDTNPFAPPGRPDAPGVTQHPYADQAIYAANQQRAAGPTEPAQQPPSGDGYDPYAPTQPPPSGTGYDPFARPSQPPPGEPPAPAGPESGDGGGRRPLVIAGIIGLVLALAVGGWLLFGNREQPAPPPGSSSQPQPTQPSTTQASQSPDQSPSSTSASPSDTESADGSGIAYQDSTRTPPWTPTRDEPRVGMAPLSEIGEPAEVVETADQRGLVTVLEHVWSDGEGNRPPAEGKKFLLIHVEIEALDGPFSYAPGRFIVIDQDHGRYDFLYASAMQDKYPLFQSGEVPAGKVLRGWVLFELAQQDVTVTYQAYDEEGLRVALPGGPAVPHQQPEIVLGQTYTDTSMSAEAEVRIEGATWFTEALSPPAPGKEYLAVKVAVSAIGGNYYASPLRFALATGGTEIEYTPVSDAAVGPAFAGGDVAQGDVYTGWVYFEVERGDVTLIIESLGPDAQIKIPG